MNVNNWLNPAPLPTHIQNIIGLVGILLHILIVYKLGMRDLIRKTKEYDAILNEAEKRESKDGKSCIRN